MLIGRIIKIAEGDLRWTLTSLVSCTIGFCNERAGKKLISAEEQRKLLNEEYWYKAGRFLNQDYTRNRGTKPPLKKKRPTRNEVTDYLFRQAHLITDIMVQEARND